MSLILEALKKSEARRQLGEAPGLGTPFTVARRRRTPWPILVVLIVAALAVGGWFWRTRVPATPAPVATRPSAPDRAANAVRSPVSVNAPPISVLPAPNAPPGGEATTARAPVVATTANPPPMRNPALTEPGAGPGQMSPNPLRTRVPATTADASRPIPGSTGDARRGTVAGMAPPARFGQQNPARATPAAPPAPFVPAPSAPGHPAVESANASPAAAPAQSAPAGTAKPVQAPLAATAPADQTRAAAPGAKPADAVPPLPYYYELPFNLRKELPPLALTMHVYAKDPAQRFVVIDNERRAEGENVKDDLVLREIRPDGVVLEFRSQRFFYPRPGR